MRITAIGLIGLLTLTGLLGPLPTQRTATGEDPAHWCPGPRCRRLTRLYPDRPVVGGLSARVARPRLYRGTEHAHRIPVWRLPIRAAARAGGRTSAAAGGRAR